MSFPRYPKYKDSGVEWLGQVPEHWEVKPLKAVATHNDDVLDETTAPDTEITYVDISSVDGVNGIAAKEAILFAAAPSRARRRVKHGDVIVSTVRTYLRAIARIREPEANLIVSTGFAVVRPGSNLAPDFLGNALSASYFVEQVIARSTGVSYPAINASELVAIPVPVPPLPEQTAIAGFLDRETGKIDELVAEQRRLMELLKEKRQAVISHAVTRGLNPAAPLKPSGIEWLGPIPTHWQLKRLKHVTIPVRGIQMGPFGGMLKDLKTEPTAFKLYGQENTINDDFACGSRWLSEEHFESLSEYELQPGDLVLTRKGASIGNCRIVPNDIQRGVIDSDTIRVRLDSKVISIGFAVILMHEGYMESAILQRQKGSVLPGLNTDTIANLPIAIPPPDEQRSILALLTEQTARFDALTAEAQRAIDLLQERRTALISAAVTGQIDVRGESSAIAPMVLPDAAQHPHPVLNSRIGGVREMKQFWRSGDPADLPENPEVAVVMDWLNRLTSGPGFEDALARLGLTHQAVMDTVFEPACNGDLAPLVRAHPIILMHCLWRIGVQFARDGADMRGPVMTETFCAANHFWQHLRRKLIAGDSSPPLVFERCSAPSPGDFDP